MSDYIYLSSTVISRFHICAAYYPPTEFCFKCDQQFHCQLLRVQVSLSYAMTGLIKVLYNLNLFDWLINLFFRILFKAKYALLPAASDLEFSLLCLDNFWDQERSMLIAVFVIFHVCGNHTRSYLVKYLAYFPLQLFSH